MNLDVNTIHLASICWDVGKTEEEGRKYENIKNILGFDIFHYINKIIILANLINFTAV